MTAARLIRLASVLYKTYGWRGALFRTLHEVRRATGAFPARPRLAFTTASPLDVLRVDPRAYRASADPPASSTRAARVLHGEYQAFGSEWLTLPSDADAWTTHPESGVPWQPHDPWWRVAHQNPANGDIKDLWEPARFGWVYDLIRGHLCDPDPAYEACFRQNFETWCASSPAFRGPHWSCGQEVSIRAIALLYAEANLLKPGTPLATGVEEVLAASGERISTGIRYALSQRNNHGISEAAALYVLGLRFERGHKCAGLWKRRGLRYLEWAIRDQFARDGWYIQHSFNYLRLALDQLTVAGIASGVAGGGWLSADAQNRIEGAAALLAVAMDPASGRVPNHGANDGAWVHPISTAGYGDFRPTLTAVCVTFGIPLPGEIPADLEAVAWLGGRWPEPAPETPDGVHCGESGWVVVRNGGTHLFFRAARYDSRPGHIDPLHIEVWFDGQPCLADPGTFRYMAEPPWRNGLADHRVHNGMYFVDEAPALRGPRFLWLRWPGAEITSTKWSPPVAEIRGRANHGVERRIRLVPGRIDVTDRSLRRGSHRATISWLLHPHAPRVRFESTARVTERHAVEGAVTGWYSERYGQRDPSTALELVAELSAGDTVRTTIDWYADRPDRTEAKRA